MPATSNLVTVLFLGVLISVVPSQLKGLVGSAQFFWSPCQKLMNVKGDSFV